MRATSVKYQLSLVCDSRDNLTTISIANISTDDGLAACPICAKRMKEEYVFAHLDVHEKDSNDSEPKKRNLGFA